MTGLLLLLALGVWIVLPFLPALHEAVRRRDDGALPIGDRYAEDLALVGAEDPDALDGGVIVRHSVVTEPGTEADEIRAHGVARLRAGTVVRRRLVVGDAVEVEPGSVLGGSAEAGEHVWLGTAVRFERVAAPTIEVGAAGVAPPAPIPAFAWAPPDADDRAGRALVVGDLTVPAGARVAGHLVVTGDLTVEAGARIGGSVKAHGAVQLGPGARVGGSAFARGDLALGPYAAVGAAAASEATLVIGPGATVGRLTAPATATGCDVTVAAGARVHGTLWAERSGVTVAEFDAGERSEPLGPPAPFARDRSEEEWW